MPKTRYPHTHRYTGKPRLVPFTGPVSAEQNVGAHGGVTYVYTCRCGATRRINRNQAFTEAGPWIAPASRQESE